MRWWWLQRATLIFKIRPCWVSASEVGIRRCTKTERTRWRKTPGEKISDKLFFVFQTFSISFSEWASRGLQGMMPALLKSKVTWRRGGVEENSIWKVLPPPPSGFSLSELPSSLLPCLTHPPEGFYTCPFPNSDPGEPDLKRALRRRMGILVFLDYETVNGNGNVVGWGSANFCHSFLLLVMPLVMWTRTFTGSPLPPSSSSSQTTWTAAFSSRSQQATRTLVGCQIYIIFCS